MQLAMDASSPMQSPTPRLRAASIWLLVSAAVHGALLFTVAGIAIQTFAPTAPIRVSIWEAPAPPPPPPGGGGAVLVAPPRVAAQPVEDTPRQRPDARPRPKLRRKLVPAMAAPRPPEPSEARPSEALGVPGGLAGGVPGGQVGGVIGGRGDRLWAADQVARPPRLLSGAKPHYPPAARARGIEGLVVLEAIIDRQGQLENDGVIVRQSVPALDAAAIAAVKQWRFDPGRDNDGTAVRVVLRVPIRFQLR